MLRPGRLFIAALSLTAAVSCRTHRPRATGDQDAHATISALDAVVQRRAPLSEMLLTFPESERQRAREPLQHFVLCSAAHDRSMCAVLPGDDNNWCTEAVAQVQARATGQHPWFGVPEAIRICAHGGDPGPCERYAAAVETRDPSLCPVPRESFADCEAVASGNPDRCVGSGSSIADCRRSVVSVAALREGVGAAAQRGDGALRYVALGAMGTECRQLLERELSASVPNVH